MSRIKYKGCTIRSVDHDADDVSLPGVSYIITDADGVSVGGFRDTDACRTWCDQHPSRAA